MTAVISPAVAGGPVTPLPPVPPGTTPQYPALRAEYAFFPPWQVSGVDRYTGATPDLVRSVPDVDAMPAGATYNAGTQQITITGDGVTFNRWAFGAVPVIGSGANAPVFIECTWDDCNGTAVNFQAGCTGGLTMENCTVTGSATDEGLDGIILYRGAGILTLTNVDLNGGPSDLIHIGTVAPDTCGYNIENALMRNNSLGAPGVHGDWLQVDSQTTIVKNRVANTTFYMDSVLSQGTQGIFLPPDGSTVYENGEFYRCTVIVPVADLVNYFLITNTSYWPTDVVVTECYFDPRGMLTPGVVFNISATGGPYSSTAVLTGNINMNTGATITT